MALQIRRGTNQERLGITPSEGEVIYVVDSVLAFTNVITISGGNLITSSSPHNKLAGDAVKFIDNSTNGFVENTVYYVLSDGLTATAFKLSLTKNGAAITTFTNGAGLTLRLATGPTDVYGIPFGYSINPLWVGDGTSVGGLPAGASTLDELSDVDIGIHDLDGIPLDANQHLEYDGATNTWRNVSSMIIPATYLDHNLATQSTVLDVQSTTDSTNSTTGAIKTAGGMGVAKALYVGTIARIGSSTDSTTKDTGALVVQNGGLGVEKAINAGTSISAGSSLSAGTSASVGTTLSVGTDITAGGDVAVNGGDITTTAGTASLFNSTASTLNIGGAASTINTGGQLNVGGDIKVGGGDIRSSDGLVNITLSSNTQTTFAGDIKVSGNDIKSSDDSIAITLSGSNVTVGGDLKITGNDIISSSNQTAITLSGTDVSMPNLLTVANQIKLTGSQPFVSFNLDNSEDGVNTVRGIRGKVSLDDAWFVGGGSVGDDDGYLLLAVSDNGSESGAGEKIIARKYGGSGTTHNTPWDTETPILTELEILGLDNNTRIPNTLYVGADLIVDTDTLVVDSTNNRVGVGITPTVKLDVNGSARIRGTSLTVDGDLIVNGTTTTLNTETLAIEDNIIVLNSNVSGAPLTNAGFEIERGTSSNVLVRWNESTDRWETTVDGTNYIELANQGLDTDDNVVFASANIGNISIANSTADNTITTSTGTLAITAANNTVDITGDTTVIGNFRTTDNIIRFNYAVDTGTPTTGTAGMAIRRGTLSDAQWVWNETYDWWEGSQIYSAGAIIAGGDLATNGRNIIFNNDDATPVDTDNMTLLVKRGTQADVSIVWDETTNRWKSTTNGSTYINFPDQNLDTGNDVQFGAAVIGNVSIAAGANNNTITTTSGDLTIDAATDNVYLNSSVYIANNTEIGSDFTDTVIINASVDDNITFKQPTSGIRGIIFNSGGNDFGGIRGGQTGNDQGYVEIATGDNGTEPIYVRQYSTSTNFNNGTSPTRTLTLLDGSGNTSVPGNLSTAGTTTSTGLITASAGVSYNNLARTDVKTITTTATTIMDLDTFAVGSLRSAKYMVEAVLAGEVHLVEVLLVTNGTLVNISTYGEITTNSSLMSVSADILGGNVRLRVTPTSTNSTTFKAVRTATIA